MHDAAELLKLLAPRPGERILDLGCGNGDLTAQIAAAGAIPTGIDRSEETVARARRKHGDLNFQVEDARVYRTDVPFDAVFSHAVLHWIQEPEAVAASVWHALREGGRFAAEFAGSGNVAAITGAIEQALRKHGYAPEGRNPWYLPTIGEYASLLERIGFRVVFAQHFDRPSPIQKDSGIRHWLNGFSEYFFADATPEDKESMYRFIESELEPRLKREGRWTADTSRLRIVAYKPPE
ncbi:methyltransferase domain-containing protein [Cohnella thailandensis]|uniref:Methyltransferase domain-containing protein n=1 Tax=Cohnella thailandensis TaxID=557557 RepID=A0A841SRZ9_9BACL|nr:methyltransferase domain-containing protein [Cohnella thailandensis]MBB6632680.1 methyltransferase domain-containing protein [Cohnella thailandensis]MBP1975630.1 trans-aconitate methyltransferase [Cohnella thailandensis]